MIAEDELKAIGFKWKTRHGERTLLLPLGNAPLSGGSQWIETGTIPGLFSVHRAANDEELIYDTASYVEFEPRTIEDLKVIIHCFKVDDNGQDLC